MGEGLNLNQNTFIIAACLRPASVVCVRADGQTGTNSLVALPKSREGDANNGCIASHSHGHGHG